MNLLIEHIPARRVLIEAEETNRSLGHENLGFLSAEQGFMPVERPRLALPVSHRAWDDMAAQLPELFRTLRLRQALARMPVLSANDLPEADLMRASTILSILAHANFYVQPEPPDSLPESVARPWSEISVRLKRPKPHLSFIDLNIYNYKLIDPDLPDPMRMENLDLLIPIVGNEDERRFQATPIEMVAQSTPALTMIIRIQEALLGQNIAAVKEELLALTDLFHHLSYVSFLKVNPNAHSPNYVNPVVWGKTVAPLATPYQDPGEGIPGPSGTAIPTFQMFDIFFGRQQYKTSVGHETARTRPWFPAHWRAFLDALEEINVVEAIKNSGDPTLQGVFQEALDAYAGDTGLLGRHRLKTYGFLDLSFKAGRSKTLGGFGGGFSDRLWDRMDGELNKARLERYQRRAGSFHAARLKRIEEVTVSEKDAVRQVVLDVRGSGIRYRPGDRCAILPVNSAELVAKTLKSLRARGDEPIQLNAVWRTAVKERPGYEMAKVLSLRTLLHLGQIRPVSREVAKALYGLSHDQSLLQIIESRAEDQWELWDLLAMLAETGFNPRQLWKAVPGEPESICWLVPPERYRMYSVSSVMAEPTAESAEEVHLTIGRLGYETPAGQVSRQGQRYGTASSFLSRLAEEGEDGRLISLKMIKPPRFSLPQDGTRPVILIAGGTGFSPFRSLLQERMRQPEAGENWLFFGTRTRGELYYEDELAGMVAAARLHLRVAVSREDVAIRSEGGQIVIEAGRRHYIGDELMEPENAQRLWQLLRPKSDGGEGAYLYVCGRTGFAGTVMAAIKNLLVHFSEGTAEEKEKAGQKMLYRLVGEDRYMQEIFTTYAGAQFDQQVVFDASEVVQHNHDEAGYWIIINGRVYDVTEFAQLHPGGQKIIQSYAGMDATKAYRMVLHDANPEVDAMLGLYEIGAVRRLNFGAAWSMALGREGLEFVPLKDLYRAWVTYLYDVVEMENALTNDYGVRLEPVTHNETDGRLEQSPYKTRLLLQTHERFMSQYLPMISGPALERLWALVSGLHSEHLPIGWLKKHLDSIQAGPAAARTAKITETISGLLSNNPSEAELAWCVQACETVETADRQLLGEVKALLRQGLQVFEKYEAEVVGQGSKGLLTAVQTFPEILGGYYERVGRVSPPPLRPPASDN